MSEITELLGQMSDDNPGAMSELMARVYGELHRLAAAYMRRERGDHTLQTTALVHEAYLRLVGQRDIAWKNRAHFLGVAAQMMRRHMICPSSICQSTTAWDIPTNAIPSADTGTLFAAKKCRA